MTRMFTIGGKRMTTWNVQVGCNFDCTYCSARKLALTRLKNTDRYREGFKPHLVEKELKRKFKPGEFVFVGYMGDIAFSNYDTLLKIFEVINAHPQTSFLFCTKAPEIYWHDHITWPGNVYMGATIETNRSYKVTKARSPYTRFIIMRNLKINKRFISIEPIMDFDPEILITWLHEIGPEIVEVGADNYHNNLEEPPWYKVEFLLEQLRLSVPSVVEKSGLERLKNQTP